MNGETNHGEAGPSPTGLRRRVGYAVILLDTPQLAAGSFIGTGQLAGSERVEI